MYAHVYYIKMGHKRVYITWTCLIVKLVKIDYFKNICVFLFLFPVVELSQRLDVGKSQPDIMEQKSMDYG